MLTNVLRLVVFGSLFVPSLAWAQQPNSPPRYFIYPVTTELQRQLSPGPIDTFILFDTTEAFKKGGEAWMDGLGLKELQKDLVKLKKTKSRLHFTLFAENTGDRPPQTVELLRYAIIGWAHQGGSSKVTAHSLHFNSKTTWADLIKSFAGKQTRVDNAEEAAKGNEIVKVYPVQTELSRFLSSNADCVVVIIPNLDKGNGSLPDAIRTAVSKYLDEAKIVNKKRITFFVHNVSVERREVLFDELNRLATKLGFDGSSISTR